MNLQNNCHPKPVTPFVETVIWSTAGWQFPANPCWALGTELESRACRQRAWESSRKNVLRWHLPRIPLHRTAIQVQMRPSHNRSKCFLKWWPLFCVIWIMWNKIYQLFHALASVMTSTALTIHLPVNMSDSIYPHTHMTMCQHILNCHVCARKKKRLEKIWFHHLWYILLGSNHLISWLGGRRKYFSCRLQEQLFYMHWKHTFLII